VDSAVLAVLGTRALGAERFLAVIGRSASYPAVQYATALDIAQRHAVPLLEVDTDELNDPRYRANTTDRCYFCKTELWSRLGHMAQERGFDVIIDGTNTDDLGEHRPGMKAGQQHAIRSPFAELGWNKPRIREVARELGLPIWDAPAAPCLSSRIRYGIEVTDDRLRQVEEGEALLRAFGVSGDLRVRHLGETARIEVLPREQAVVQSRWPEIEIRFQELGFTAVTLDPLGYRRGALLTESPVQG
jgi:uncharacterized protein